LREHECNVLVLPGEPAARPQRPIERLIDQSRHLGFVGNIETGVEIRLQRKFAQQRQAERVDRADGDVVDPVAELAPPGGRKLTARSSRPKRGDDPLAHFRCRLACESNRENV